MPITHFHSKDGNLQTTYQRIIKKLRFKFKIQDILIKVLYDSKDSHKFIVNEVTSRVELKPEYAEKLKLFNILKIWVKNRASEGTGMVDLDFLIKFLDSFSQSVKVHKMA